ncbi:hypothetical protein LCGC14_1002640 [marine sediment metagenome]|uniref:Zinc finger CHC2-type domain-containing protein n=1 Tax=marine sediment metagenome TaxID=412755 RepID=A0A0F9QL45_9ZZZZ
MKEASFIKRLDELDIKHSPSGLNVMIDCPFHEDTNSHMGVHFEKNKFHCFSCGAFGSSLTRLFDALFEGKKEDVYVEEEEVDEDDQIRRLREKLGNVGKKKKLMIKVLINFDLDDFKFPYAANKEYGDYLQERRITPLSAGRWDIRCGEWRGASRIIIPMYDEYKRLIAVYGRSIIDDKVLRIRKSKGADVGKILFGLEHLKNRKVGVLVEGEFDAIYLQQYGIPAISIGTKRPTKIQIMKMAKKFRKVYLSLDGEVSMRECSEIAWLIKDHLPVEIRYLPLDKDPNDLIEDEVKEIYKGLY